jgi:NMD protein affecting ribosome stability and mRNA decay
MPDDEHTKYSCSECGRETDIPDLCYQCATKKGNWDEVSDKWYGPGGDIEK